MARTQERTSLPPWLRTRLGSGDEYNHLRSICADQGLHTVCASARCPNLGECWSAGTATFMVLGDTCTRGCRFCSVRAGRPLPPDPGEPARLGRTLAELGLRYAVLTMVCRDDLADHGASHVASCVTEAKAASPGIRIETLVGDLQGDREALRTVLGSGPDVLGHNVETVERLNAAVRHDRCDYRRSLDVLVNARTLAPTIPTKSSLMLGLGETDADVRRTLGDLRRAGVSLLTIGQYLRPGSSRRHPPVRDYIAPEVFERWAAEAKALGFSGVASGPFVRSSYRAGELAAFRLAASSREERYGD